MNLKSLAEQLGLSPTTVSRALNGYPEVSDSTRQRVAEAAMRLGYRPNVSARRLATGRVGAVGVFLPAQGSVALGPHTSEFLSGLASRMAHEEIDIVVSPLETEDEVPAYHRLVSTKRVDAVVISSPAISDQRVKVLSDLKMPFALHGRTDIGIPHAWLDIDNQGGHYAATSHLIELGHRRIALINGPAGMTFSAHREAGYRAALAAGGIAVDTALIGNDIFTDETGFRQAELFLATRPRPTAIIAGSMMSALGAFRAIRSAGLELGRDVSMIAHDDVFPYLNADRMVPTMSTMRSPIRDAGSRIGEMVLQLLAGAPVEQLCEVWPVELVLRQSTCPAP
ncbi:MAG TPA: substrate-binding domain-containing protein [Devosiaceae bacterium]